MRVTTLVSAAAIALAATIGSVTAADQFATLDGVSAVPMSSGELAAVKGQHVHFQVITTQGLVNPDSNDAAAPISGPFFRVGDPFGGPALAPGAEGLLHADAVEGNPIVVFCGSNPCL